MRWVRTVFELIDDKSIGLIFDVILNECDRTVIFVNAPFCGWQRKGGPDELVPCLLRVRKIGLSIDFGSEYDEADQERYNLFRLDRAILRTGELVDFVEDDGSVSTYRISRLIDLLTKEEV